MQYHGVGRHHDQWPHALNVVANGTMTGQRYIEEVLLPYVRLFRGAVGDKFVFMDDNATYLNPIENVWDALERQVAGRNYPPTNKNTLIRALTEEWDKLPQQLLDNVVQEVWYDVWNVASHSTVDISRTDIPFFKVPADFLDALFPFLRTQIK
ncbi:transposable element Tc1 transposase [Trichonephila clavipes]|nr:transposable element Tc1 transposase [Trichonephila clavipes]